MQAVAARDEDDDENPLAAARRRANGNAAAALARVFGTAPGAYGAGVEDRLGGDADRAAVGAAYLAAASHSMAAPKAEGAALPGAFAERVAAADLLVHASDDPARDLLEGDAEVQPSSADFRPRPRRSAAHPISSCST